MKIRLLQKREPFSEILQKTLIDFFANVYKQKYEVVWNESGKKRHNGWLVNANLNVIFLPHANRKIFHQTKKEFSRSIKWWLRPWQKLYVFLSLNRFSAKYFSTDRLKINPQLKRPENILIIGGNHHLRILDYNADCSFVINKAGFNQQFMINEVQLRQKHTFLPTPKILAVATDYAWYSEEIISGAPLNRISRYEQAAKYIEPAIQSLIKLAEKTAVELDLLSYVNLLQKMISSQLEKINLPIANEKQKYLNAIDKITEIVKKFGSRTLKITACSTHGDLQAANIIVTNERSWLIDWEYTDQRQASYDVLVFILQSRSPVRLARRIINVYNNPPARLLNWPLTNWSIAEERKKYLTLFILEELALKLNEQQTPFLHFNFGHEAFLREVDIGLSFLKKI